MKVTKQMLHEDLQPTYGFRTRPCVVIAPDYRKSFTAPFPAGFNDCYDTLLWARDNAVELGILPQKFIVAGHSAGGGLAAAVTLKARDTRDVDIAFQIYWETASYVESLRRENIEVAYEEYEGCYHGFDSLGGNAEVSKRALEFTCQNFGSFYDSYVATRSDSRIESSGKAR